MRDDTIAGTQSDIAKEALGVGGANGMYGCEEEAPRGRLRLFEQVGA